MRTSGMKPPNRSSTRAVSAMNDASAPRQSRPFASASGRSTSDRPAASLLSAGGSQVSVRWKRLSKCCPSASNAARRSASISHDAASGKLLSG